MQLVAVGNSNVYDAMSVDVNFRDISIRDALKSMCDGYDLSCAISDDGHLRMTPFTSWTPEQSTLGFQISAVFFEMLTAKQDEDIDRLMKTIHTQSPCYRQIKEQMPAIFANFDFCYRAGALSPICCEGEYAVVRNGQTTIRVSGPRFQNNAIDFIQVYRKENGQWKFWNQAILGITLINE